VKFDALFDIAPASARAKCLVIVLVIVGMPLLPNASASAPLQQGIPTVTTQRESSTYVPPVIRSVRQSEDHRMLGDRTATEVDAAFQSEQGRAVVAPSMCPWPISCAPPPPPSRSGRLRLDVYAFEIDAASAHWGVDPMLVRAVVHAESAFNAAAVSPKGAQGLMQLMPATAARFDVEDPFDPQQNINAGVRYLAWLIKRFDGDTRLATAAYNAGEGAVDRHGGVPPYAETTAYVAKVDALTHAYREASANGVHAAAPLASLNKRA